MSESNTSPPVNFTAMVFQAVLAAAIIGLGAVLWSTLATVGELTRQNQDFANRLIAIEAKTEKSQIRDEESTADRAALHAVVLQQQSQLSTLSADVGNARTAATGVKTEAEQQFKSLGQWVNGQTDDEHQRFCLLYETLYKLTTCPFTPKFFPTLFD